MKEHDYVLIKLYWHKQAGSHIWPLSCRLSAPELDEQGANILKAEEFWRKNKILEFWKPESESRIEVTLILEKKFSLKIELHMQISFINNNGNLKAEHLKP